MCNNRKRDLKKKNSNHISTCYKTKQEFVNVIP